MPCSLCGETRHNRRTCQRWWDLLLATHLEESHRDRQNNTSSDNLLPVTAQHMSERPPEHILNPLFTTPPFRHSTIRNNITLTNNTLITTHNDSITIGTIVNTTHNDMSPIRPDILFPEWDSDEDTSFIRTDIHLPPFSSKLVDCVQEPCKTNDCPICMEDLHKTDLFVTRCGHQFHGTCMIQHIKLHDNCPMCRGLLFQTSNP